MATVFRSVLQHFFPPREPTASTGYASIFTRSAKGDELFSCPELRVVKNCRRGQM
jgi:hypothetical protein